MSEGTIVLHILFGIKVLKAVGTMDTMITFQDVL